MNLIPNTKARGVLINVWEDDGGNLCKILPNGHSITITANVIGYNNERDKKSLNVNKIIHLINKEVEFFIHAPIGNETYLVSITAG